MLSPNSDWELVSQRAQKFGPVTSVYLSMRRIGAPILAHPSGDIINNEIGSLNPDFCPHIDQGQASMSTAGAGFTASVLVYPSGSVALSAIPPNVELPTGGQLSIQGTWMAS